MMNVKKYQKQYYMPPVPCMDWAEKDLSQGRKNEDFRPRVMSGDGCGDCRGYRGEDYVLSCLWKKEELWHI